MTSHGKKLIEFSSWAGSTFKGELHIVCLWPLLAELWVDIFHWIMKSQIALIYSCIYTVIIYIHKRKINSNCLQSLMNQCHHAWNVYIWMLGPVDRHNPESDRNCHQQSSIYYLITQKCPFLNKNNELSVPSLSIHRWDIVVNEGVLLSLFWILLQEATQKSSWIWRLAGDVELTLDMDKDINSECNTFLA